MHHVCVLMNICRISKCYRERSRKEIFVLISFSLLNMHCKYMCTKCKNYL